MSISLFGKLGEAFGFKSETTLPLGAKFMLVNPNTGVKMEATLVKIGKGSGQLMVEYTGYNIPQIFADQEALQQAIREANGNGKKTPPPSPHRERVPTPTSPPGGPKHEHRAYTNVLPRGAEPYQERERITSKTESVQGKVYLPEVLEQHMEAIVVDYKKDPVLKEYIETNVLPFLLRERLADRIYGVESVIACLSKKIALNFPYQYEMLKESYSRARYPVGQKVTLGAFMHNQDMICRHKGLLFAAIIDYLKAHAVDQPVGIPADSEVRFMADQQRDLEEEKTGGHAYCILQEGKDCYVVDPTTGLAKDVKMIFTSDEMGGEKFRYLFSALRFMFQNPRFEDKDFILKIMEKAKTDQRFNELVNDLRRTLGADYATWERFVKLERESE
jgi:hypothetical protein